MKNLGFKILFVIYLLFVVADIGTTLSVEHNEILEANLIYDYVGFTGIIIVNCAIALSLWWLYSRRNSTPGSRYILIMAMLMIIAMRIYALQNAIFYIQNPITYEQAISIATPAVMMETTKQIARVGYPPFILGVFGYIFWRIDHHVRRKE